MTERILLSAGRHNLEACVDLAVERGLGIEVMAFSYPDVLDGDWEAEVRRHQKQLARVPGLITLHGPFMDMVSGSPDSRINQVCFQRYIHAIHIANMLGAELVTLHANFIGSLHNLSYRLGWHERNLKFWNALAERAREEGMTIALENMWEFDPDIIGDVLREVNHPNLLACLDVGHSHLFSDKPYDLQDWLNTLKPWLVHTHMNNNNGLIDEHHGFNWPHGVLNYHDVLRQIRALPYQPNIVLEMDLVEDMRESLSYFEHENA